LNLRIALIPALNMLNRVCQPVSQAMLLTKKKEKTHLASRACSNIQFWSLTLTLRFLYSGFPFGTGTEGTLVW
jgi:hypothetical protein